MNGGINRSRPGYANSRAFCDSSIVPARTSRIGTRISTSAISSSIRRIDRSARYATIVPTTASAITVGAITACAQSTRTSKVARMRLGTVTMSPTAVTTGTATASRS
jgi:hypothetical protein